MLGRHSRVARCPSRGVIVGLPSLDLVEAVNEITRVDRDVYDVLLPDPPDLVQRDS